ncbi:hypothetical protein [Sphaerochaeta sp. UBA5849]|uniref:hypothetical protein n=1 Tax=Sphaerochaeta sp. UBA5849 TaxID=1947475 RepID=UPI0031F5568D
MQRPRMMVSVSRVASGRFMACSVAWTDWVFNMNVKQLFLHPHGWMVKYVDYQGII